MSLAGLSILVLEDEPIIAIALEDALLDGGAEPVSVGSLEGAERLIADRVLDAALLDVNIGNANSYPIAYKLRERGIPFIFATGYGGALHGEDFADVPTIAKPYSLADIESAFARVMAS